MKKAVLFFATFVFLGFAQAQSSQPARVSPDGSQNQRPSSSQPAKQELSQTQIMKVDDVRPGMKGIGYTVFQGTKPEPMGVEVLGVLRNWNGPKSDVVLVRLQGEKAEFTGVVQGMSGSPVYIDGKLLGAIAYRIGQFSKEPIAGVTPIEQMLEISEFDRSIPAQGSASSAKPSAMEKTSGPGVSDTSQLQGVAQYLQPIDSPF